MSQVAKRHLYPQQSYCPDFCLRGNLDWKDHDLHGFRKTHNIETSDILAIGDSFAYGPTVWAEETWPACLEHSISQKVYNASCCGWGTLQYYLTVEHFCEILPPVILLGLFPASDIYEAYRHTLRSKSELISSENRHLNEFAENPVFSEWRDRAKVIRALRQSYEFSELQALKFCQKKDISDCSEVIWRNKSYFLTPKIRQASCEWNDPAVRTGFDLTLKYLNRIKRLTQEQSSKLYVIMFPTKEFIMWQQKSKLQASYDLKAQMECLWIFEKSLKNRIMDNFDATYIDLFSYLGKVADSHYFNEDSDDAHLTAAGNAAVANFIARRLNL